MGDSEVEWVWRMAVVMGVLVSACAGVEPRGTWEPRGVVFEGYPSRCRCRASTYPILRRRGSIKDSWSWVRTSSDFAQNPAGHATREPASTQRASLSQSDIAPVFRARLPSFKRCYEAELDRNAEAQDRCEVYFTALDTARGERHDPTVPGAPRHLLTDLGGTARLVMDGTRGVLDVVEGMHGTIQRATFPVGRPPARRTFGITGFVYRRLHDSLDWVDGALEAAVESGTRILPDPSAALPPWDSLLAPLNGVWGDHLHAHRNPLALPMTLRASDAPEHHRFARNDRFLILLHGLCLDDGCWATASGQDHAVGLAAESEMLPLYVRYNTGLSVVENGRNLSALLEDFIMTWPRPVQELVVLAYSMGGLVARSACRHAELHGHGWRRRLRRLITVGTPHLGSPVERAGTWVDAALEVSAYSAPLARLTKRRSAGIADLGRGNVTEVDGEHVPLPDGVDCHAIAGARAPRKEGGRSRGDGLVTIDSALGRHPQPDRRLAFREDHVAVVQGVSHLGLLSSHEAFRHMVRWAK